MKKRIMTAMTTTLFAISCGADDEINTECIEEKKDSCVVTFEINPVCGCNGKTYPNPSTAKCNGIDDYTMGACD